MTHLEFSAALLAAGLQPRDLAKLTGKHEVTVWRWTRGKLPIPEYALTIVRLKARLIQLTSYLSINPPTESLP